MVELSLAKAATHAAKITNNQVKGLGTEKVLSASHMSSKELNIKNWGTEKALSD